MLPKVDKTKESQLNFAALCDDKNAALCLIEKYDKNALPLRFFHFIHHSSARQNLPFTGAYCYTTAYAFLPWLELFELFTYFCRLPT